MNFIKLFLFSVLLMNGCVSWKVISKDAYQTIYTKGDTLRICHGENRDEDCGYIYKLPNGKLRICEHKKPCEEMTGEHFLSHFF